MKKCSAQSINAVVLSGGKSRRMGEDKSQMTYHGIPQEIHVANICAELGLATYIGKGCFHDQDRIGKFKVINDLVRDKGPIAGIIAAMQSAPDKAWLVLACDMPLITSQYIEELLLARDPNCMATTYHQEGSQRFEPLFCIYEGSILPYLESELHDGKGKITAVLKQCKVKIVPIDNHEVTTNVNTRAEEEAARKTLENRRR